MKFGLIAALLIYSIAGAQAQAPNPSSITPKPIEPRMLSLLASCSAEVKATEKDISASFVNGAKFEIVKDENGRALSFTYTSAEGEQQTIRANGEGSKNEPENSTTSEAIKRDASYIQMRKLLAASFKKSLIANCKRQSVESVSAENKSEKESTISASKLGDGEMAPMGHSDYDQYSFLFDDSGLRDAIDYMVEDMFYQEMAIAESRWFQAGASWLDKPPTCSLVISDCQNTCTRLGTYGGGVACTAIGGIAGFALTPPIGLAAGAYCAGKVFVATEQCRYGCQAPIIRCTW